MRFFSSGTLFFLIALLITSCANVATPSGGDYDETPPRFVSGNPPMNQTGFKKSKLELFFDENITLESVSEKVIVSPPQIKPPIIRGIAKKVTVEFQDSLMDNTTYTIDFNDAIVDNNEKNPLEGFSFAFSTGATIDSLALSGTLLNARDLEPMQNVVVGLHRNLDDSAFLKLPFLRTSKTNDRGNFTIRNIAEGSYHLFALKDMNGNYRFDQKEEEIAYLDSIIIPATELETRQDTVWKDSITIDTIKPVEYTRFYPDNLLLLLFKEELPSQYLQKTERAAPGVLTFTFEAPLPKVPGFRLLDEEDIPADSLFSAQLAEKKKVLRLWVKDSAFIARDTLSIEITYEKNDSLYRMLPQTDTILFVTRKMVKPVSKKKEVDTLPQITTFSIKADIPSTMDIFAAPSLEFPEPFQAFDSTHIRLEVKKDTLWQPYSFRLQQDTANTLIYTVQGRWNYDESYRLSIDSAAVSSIYGLSNLPLSSEFKIKAENSYSHLYFNFPEISSSAFVELLDASDKVVRTARVREKGALFRNVLPGKYYARIVLDLNGNGRWDSGNYGEKRQPEPVYYYPSVIELIQNWEIEQNWNIYERPLNRQKPADVIQNKPKEKKRRESRNQQRGQNKNQNHNQSSGQGNLR